MGEITKVETNIFDKEEIYPDCTVQILTNTLTGEQSIGWWPNDCPPAGWRGDRDGDHQ